MSPISRHSFHRPGSRRPFYRYEVVPWRVWGNRRRDAVKLGTERWDILAGLAEDKKHPGRRIPADWETRDEGP